MAMTKTIQATVKNRTDTAANWTQKNPVLAEGEIIVVQTSAGETRLKIGDGVKTFTQLPYTDEQIYNNVVTSVNGQTGDVTLDIPDGGADWAQNNPDGDGYIKNRPGGYMTDPVITDVDTFTITSAEDQGGVYFAVVAVESSAITLSDYVIGDGVIVDFGGQSYSLTWQSMEGFPACGAAITGEAPDWSAAPFCIIAVFGEKGLQGYYVYLQNAVTSPIQVKLKMAKQTPVKIPEKYLDLDSAKEIMQFTISYNQHTGKYESDRTYDELKAALDAGKTVFAKFINVMGEFYTYGLLYQRHMYVPGIWVYTGGSDPCEWQCAEGNKWTKRQLLRLSTGIGEPKKAGTAAYGTSEYASRDDHVHPSELPDVSADDDGKLLGVTGGAWGKVDMPSGGGLSLGLASAAVGQIPKIKAVDSNGVPTEWEAATFSGSSSDYVINVTLDTLQSSIGNWVLGYSCTCDKTYAEVLAAYRSGAKVLAHVTRNKEITLSDGSKRTIPIINEAPLTRYIAAQNLLVFDYVHNATDLSVSSGGLTYTTGDSGDSMICYIATYQFALGAADTSADSVQIPTTTKVQDMIDTSVSDINTNTYTIQVSNTAPAAGTSDKIITYVVEDTVAESKNSLLEQ